MKTWITRGLLAMGLAAGTATPGLAQDFKPTAQVRGMVTGWYAFDTDAPDAFRIRRVNLYVTGDVTPKVSYMIMAQPHKLIALPGIAATTENGQMTYSATAAGDRSILQDAFMTVDLGDSPFSLTLGQFRPPLSAEARNPAPRLPLATRALFLEGNAFGFYRDLGAQLSGKILPPLTLSLGVFNGELTNRRETNHTKDAIARLDYQPWKDLRLGTAYLYGSTGAAAAFKQRLDVNAAYTVGPVAFSGELLAGTDAAVNRAGAYAQTAWRFHPDFQVVGRFQRWDEDLAVAGDVQHATLGLNWFLDDKGTKFGLNVIHEDVSGAAPTSGDQALLQYQVIL